jgi:selenocysteine lyase/cysteine desulfurase
MRGGASAMNPPLPRHLFDLEPGLLWVMHCAEGPVPRASVEAATAFLVKEAQPWKMGWNEDFQGLPVSVREEAAALVGADPSDITPTPTTSSGLITVARGFPWQAGDEVVAPLGEFPTNAWPWLALAPRGVGFREVPLWDGHRAGADAWSTAPPPAGVEPEERLLTAIGPRTRILAASWVRFQDGLALDLARLGAACRARGVALVVDGIQGAGTLPLALPASGASAFACGGHKGLLAPQGQGFLWTGPGFRARLAPPGGWLSVEDATDFARPTTDFARRFVTSGTALEQGVPNLLGMAALAASLATLNAAGVGAVAAHVAVLQDRLLSGLAALPAWRAEAARLAGLRARGRLGSIVALHHGGRGPAALEALLERGFAAGIHASIREGYLRIALHGWHDEAEVERLVAWLAAA